MSELVLRPYQIRTLAKASRLFDRGAKSVLIACPTGGGKTAMAAVAMRNHLAADKSRRGFWAAHRHELINQAIHTLRGYGVDAGGINSASRCIVAMAQTIVARSTAPRATFCVFDEARHYVANEWGEVRRAYADVRSLGLDATPERSDGKGLSGAFEHLVLAAQVKELIRGRWLVKCRVLGAQSELGKEYIAQDPVEAYKRYTPKGVAVVFCSSVRMSRDVADGFRANGIPASHVDGVTPPDARTALLARFGKELRVICNVNVLTEGWDSPIADTCIIARGCSTPGPYIQMVGRVMRPYPGKTVATVLDLRGITSVLGLPDEDRIYSLEGRAITLKSNPESICNRCTKFPCECDKMSSTFTAPTVTGEELVDWYSRYRRAKDTFRPPPHVLALASIMRRAQAAEDKGNPWKRHAVALRYRYIFHRDPDEKTIEMAKKINSFSAGALEESSEGECAE